MWAADLNKDCPTSSKPRLIIQSLQQGSQPLSLTLGLTQRQVEQWERLTVEKRGCPGVLLWLKAVGLRKLGVGHPL